MNISDKFVFCFKVAANTCALLFRPDKFEVFVAFYTLWNNHISCSINQETLYSDALKVIIYIVLKLLTSSEQNQGRACNWYCTPIIMYRTCTHMYNPHSWFILQCRQQRFWPLTLLSLRSLTSDHTHTHTHGHSMPRSILWIQCLLNIGLMSPSVDFWSS